MAAKKKFRVMGNARLDRIFNQAYQKTMHDVDREEQAKRAGDHLDAFEELFDQELSGRDLTAKERAFFLSKFREYIQNTEENRHETKLRQKKRFVLGSSVIVAAGLSLFLLYAAIYRPFTPIDTVETQLVEYLQKVELNDIGEYAKKFYNLLGKYDRRLGNTVTEEYKNAMYESLHAQFGVLIGRLQEGEIRYFDDAKKWAGHFPDREDRRARREQVDNALAEGLGEAVGGTLEKVKTGIKGLFEDIKESIKGN